MSIAALRFVKEDLLPTRPTEDGGSCIYRKYILVSIIIHGWMAWFHTWIRAHAGYYRVGVEGNSALQMKEDIRNCSESYYVQGSRGEPRERG